MTRFQKVEGRYLQMQQLLTPACLEVSIRGDVPVSEVQFPEDAAICQLWKETTRGYLASLRRPPTRPYGKFFTFAPDIDDVKNAAYFLDKLEERCVFITSSFTSSDLATAQINLSHSPLFLVSFEQNGQMCEAFVTAVEASNILNPEFTRHLLKDDVIELRGSRIMRRTVTSEERKMIREMAWRNG